jgi:hypothetical protein
MMWPYVLLAALMVLAVVFLMQKKREKFLGMKLPSDWTDKIKLPFNLNEKNTKDIKFPFNLTEKINKVLDTIPKGTAPSMTFEGDKYVPGYFKIQTEFPMLTKRKLRTFDIHA